MTGSGGEVLRVGLVGCGLATQSLHVPALQFLAASYRISAVADASEAVAAAVAARTGARVVGDAFRLVEDPEVDVVAICTPDASTSTTRSPPARRRRAVLVEKPMTPMLHGSRARRGRGEDAVPVLVNYPHVYDYATASARSGAPRGTRLGEFHCFLGDNDDYIADVLQMIRPPVRRSLGRRSRSSTSRPLDRGPAPCRPDLRIGYGSCSGSPSMTSPCCGASPATGSPSRTRASAPDPKRSASSGSGSMPCSRPLRVR
jgi:hypothetical protein